MASKFIDGIKALLKGVDKNKDKIKEYANALPDLLNNPLVRKWLDSRKKSKRKR
jgi:hypothetical protein